MRTDITKLFEHQLDVDPPLEQEKLLEIPAKRGIVMLASHDQPVTMMTAASIRQRLRTRLEHPTEGELKKTADLRKVTTKIFWTETFSEFETDLEFLRISRKLWSDDFTRLLAWKPANFVCAGVNDEYPRLRVVRANADFGLNLIGPFATSRQAESLVTCVNDLFDLCRDYRCLRQYPDSQGCAYRQMKKCVGVCCGDITLDEYRRLFTESFAQVCGGLGEYRDQLESKMKQQAADLQFELAAASKKKIHRLDEYLKTSRQISKIARPFEQFKFLSVQRGSRFDRARVFAVNLGRVKELGEIEFPVTEKAACRILQKMGKYSAQSADHAPQWLYSVGLVSSYLFSSPAKQGLFMRYDANLSPDQIVERIIKSADILKLRESKRKKKAADKDVKTDQSE